MPKKLNDKNGEKTKKTKKKATSTKKKTTASTSSTRKKAVSSVAKKATKTIVKKTDKKVPKAINKKAVKEDNKITIEKKKKTTTKKTTKPASKSTQKVATKKVSKTDKKTLITTEYYDLPFKYNKTTIKILAQTPKMLFVYWEISDEDRQNLVAQYGKNFFENTKPVLIIHNLTQNYTFEIDINDYANSWYLHIDNTHCNYYMELGRRSISSEVTTNYIYIASSNTIESPNDRILFDENQQTIYFRNVKTNIETSKSITSLSLLKNIGKIYNIYNLYKKIYNDEMMLDDTYLDNPTSIFK